jgi:hypothetical protein
MFHELICLYPLDYILQLYGFSNLEIESIKNGTTVIQK